MNYFDIFKSPAKHAKDLLAEYGNIDTALLICDNVLPCYVNNMELTNFWLDVRSELQSKKRIEITELQEY